VLGFGRIRYREQNRNLYHYEKEYNNFHYITSIKNSFYNRIKY